MMQGHTVMQTNGISDGESEGGTRALAAPLARRQGRSAISHLDGRLGPDASFSA